jgi:hypothetical protein
MLTQSKKIPLGKVLVGLKFCSVEQVKQGLKHAKENMMMLGEALMDLGFLDDENLAKALAKQQGVKFVLASRRERIISSMGLTIVMYS